MAQITWRNVDAPDLRSVAQIQAQGAGMINAGLTDLANVAGQMANNQIAFNQKEQANKLGEFNLELSQMSPEQIQEFMASDAYNSDALKERFGNNVDLNQVVGDVRTARDASIDNVMKMTQYSNMQDAEADKQLLPGWYERMSAGDIKGAQEIAKNFKSPDIANNAFNTFRKTMEADRSYGLDLQRLSLDKQRTAASVAASNAQTNSINMRNKAMENELNRKAALANLSSTLLNATKSAPASTGSTDKTTAVKTTPDKPRSFGEMFQGIVDTVTGKAAAGEPVKMDTPVGNDMTVGQMFTIAALNGDRNSIRRALEANNAELVRQKKQPVPITNELIDAAIETTVQGAMPDSNQASRITSRITNYDKQLNNTVRDAKEAANVMVTGGRPVYDLFTARRLNDDVTSYEDAVAKVNQYYQTTAGKDAIDDQTATKYMSELKDMAKDMNVNLTDGQLVHLFTMLPPDVSTGTYFDRTRTNKQYARNLLKEYANEVNSNSTKLMDIDNQLAEQIGSIEETAAAQSNNAKALIHTNIISGKNYNINLPAATRLDNQNSTINMVNMALSNKTHLKKVDMKDWKKQQEESMPKPVYRNQVSLITPYTPAYRNNLNK